MAEDTIFQAPLRAATLDNDGKGAEMAFDSTSMVRQYNARDSEKHAYNARQNSEGQSEPPFDDGLYEIVEPERGNDNLSELSLVDAVGNVTILSSEQLASLYDEEETV